MKPVSMHVFGTTFHDLMGIGIRYAQRGATPYHVGAMFLMEDGTQIGFEASMGKDGWIEFPFLEKSKHYIGNSNRMQGRTIAVMRIPLSQNQTETLFIEAKRMKTSVKSYPGKLMMISMLLHQRRGWPMRKTKDIPTCSEGIAQLLYKVGIDLRDEKNDIFDNLSPSEVWVNLKNKI